MQVFEAGLDELMDRVIALEKELLLPQSTERRQYLLARIAAIDAEIHAFRAENAGASTNAGSS